jgi:excinuclease ABC subunit C
VAAAFQFEVSLPFVPERAAEILRQIPALPGILALYGTDAQAQPYLTRAADIRRRVTRILAPADSQSKRLSLRDRVASISYTITGSEFESTLALYHAAASIFGLPEARRRLKLHTPFFLRFTVENAHPRVYSTNRLSRRALAQTYGPFPSRAAAERYADAVLDLFKLRRCYEDLVPHPDHPGCVYQEMKKCLAPCNLGHISEHAAAYSAEAAALEVFFRTQGESMLGALAAERDAASAEMDFERAAALHAQHARVKAAAMLADELVRPIPSLRAAILQRAVQPRQAGAPPEQAAVFLLHAGCLAGPALLSTMGVRAVKEQTSVGSSLFAQPLMLQAVPLERDHALPVETPASLNPEQRASTLIAALERQTPPATDLALLSDHLSLLRRWYYRPEKQRAGEVFLPNPDGAWPVRRILNGAARMTIGSPAAIAETNRDAATRNPEDVAAKAIRTRMIHAGRPGVERTVPVLGPLDRKVHVVEPPPPTFTSRRRR